MAADILLIDDDLDDQEIFLMALEEIDTSINCVVEKDCIKAIENLKNNMAFLPQYIFLDVNMHKMSGMDCLVELKKCFHLADSKIIIYSTSADKRIVDRSRELGAYDYLVKPPSVSLLVETLTKVLK